MVVAYMQRQMIDHLEVRRQRNLYQAFAIWLIIAPRRCAQPCRLQLP